MTTRQLCSGVLWSLAVIVIAAGAMATEIVPVAEVELRLDEGAVVGHYLVADGFDRKDGPTLTAAVLESTSGVRLLETDRIDRENGQAIQRLEDLASGWWAELVHDFGFRNLGGPEDYADPVEWMIAIRDREAQERAPSTYTFRLSDGRVFEWVVPYGEKELGEARREETLASLAASLTQERPPSTTQRGVELLMYLQGEDAAPRLTAERLVEELWRAFQAADLPRSPQVDSLQVVRTARSAEHDRLIKVVKRNLGSSLRRE